MPGLPTVLVSMPFMDIDRPSIQLGLLKAIGEAHGFPVRTLHANLDFAARVGVETYRRLAQSREPMAGDWLFSVEAFGAAAPDPGGELLPELRRMREEDVPAFLDELMAAVPWHEVRVAAFSCTFQQSVASFALARRLKRCHPGIVTVFGGANFDGEMGPELVRTFDFIDFAVVGEGDTAFPRLLRALSEGDDPAAIPGVVTRCGGAVSVSPPAPPLESLDDSPIPDYAEFFTRAAAKGLTPQQVWLPFESSRGCWWGAKHHCTFCGLNATTMRFRSKSPKRVIGELAALSGRYGSRRFEAVDNILDPRYLKEFFPNVTGYQFFYEVKANLTRAQLALLARAGVTHLQPGLESLSSNVLRLMDKGVRAAQNVNLLRWARYYGIDVAWSILWGFPGETPCDYAEQAAVMAHLVHLQPPGSADRIWLERFSPLFDRMPHRVPERSYRHIYPSDVDLERVAYFFEYGLDGGLPDSAYDAVRRAVTEWNAAWESGRPALTYRGDRGLLEILDRRHPEAQGTYTFRGTLAEIYLACSQRPATASRVRSCLSRDTPADAIEVAFAEFAKRGLMFLDGSLAVALALPDGEPSEAPDLGHEPDGDDAKP